MRIAVKLAVVLIVIAAGIDGHANADEGTPKASRKLVATVLSESIYADEIDPSSDDLRERPRENSEQWLERFRGRRLEGRIVEPLHRRFCAEHACEPTEAEIQAVRRQLKAAADKLDKADKGDAGALKQESPGMVPGGRDTFQAMEQEIAREWIGGWKFQSALYKKYGGKVISQVMGPNAVGAYRSWLEEEEASGHFRIVTPELRAAFFEAVSGYGGRTISADEATRSFANPPWSAAPRD